MRGYFMAYGKQTEKRDDARSFDHGGKPSVGFGPRPTNGALGDKLSLGGGAGFIAFFDFCPQGKDRLNAPTIRSREC
jgi:hypothetical protein